MTRAVGGATDLAERTIAIHFLVFGLRSELVTEERFELAALRAFGQPAGDGVPETPPERVGELAGLVGAAGHLHDSVGTRSTDRLVLGERSGEVITTCEPIGEDDGILDRVRGAVSDAGRRRVRGVAGSTGTEETPPPRGLAAYRTGTSAIARRTIELRPSAPTSRSITRMA